MVQLNTTNNKTLNIILANTNRALGEVLKQSSAKDLSSFTQTKDLGSVLESLLRNGAQNKTQNQELLQLLKNNPTLKELGDVTSTLKNLQQTLQKEQSPQLEKLQKLLSQRLNGIEDIDSSTLKKSLENSGIFLESKLKGFISPKTDLKALTQELLKVLQNSKLPTTQTVVKDLNSLLQSDLFTTKSDDIKTLTQLTQKLDTLLKTTAQQMNSHFDKVQHPKDPLFLQSTKELHTKITQRNHIQNLQDTKRIQELFNDDMKNIVKKSLEELQGSNSIHKNELVKQLDKLSMQIDYYQLLSHLSDASAIYIPYSFDALEDGNITIKNTKNGKFFCDIDLELKEYGNLKLRLGIFEKNQLNMNIECQSTLLQSKLQENLKELRENLFHAGIYPQDIRFVNYEKDDTTYLATDDLALGFEVKA